MYTSIKSFFLTNIIFFSIGFSQSECDSVRYNTELFSDINVTTDVEYGENISEDILGIEYTQTLYLDVYTPVNDSISGRPLIIFLFGGAFVGGSKPHPLCRNCVHVTQKWDM